MLRRTFLLAAVSGVRRENGLIDFTENAKPITSLHYAEKWDKPFLYPLRTAKGQIISRGWPIEPRPGEKEDHAWHRGIWWGHGDVNKHDFWRELGRQKTSTLAAKGQPKLIANGCQIDLDMRTPTGAVIGSVHQTYTFHLKQDLIIDARIAIHADHNQPLVFGDTDDGGFAFRLADEFRQDRGATLLNSEGLQTTERIWGQPARWVNYSAQVNGAPIGVTIFDHPSNLRHPTRWHARGYSLCSANPFGLRAFTKDKTQDGSYTLDAGKTLEFRYRVLIHEGQSGRAALDKAWSQYK
ncbi:MAG: PmoA family protein [Acidobacteria bacterium]|nr:PmoA family protein [Acidobacteriota bacterium]